MKKQKMETRVHQLGVVGRLQKLKSLPLSQVFFVNLC